MKILYVANERRAAQVAGLKSGADDYVANSQSLLADLSRILSVSIQRPQPITRATRPPLRVLYVGDAALARQCLARWPSSIEITEATRASNGTSNGTSQPPLSELLGAGSPLPFDILVVEHHHPDVDAFAILKDVARD